MEIIRDYLYTGMVNSILAAGIVYVAGSNSYKFEQEVIKASSAETWRNCAAKIWYFTKVCKRDGPAL